MTFLETEPATLMQTPRLRAGQTSLWAMAFTVSLMVSGCGNNPNGLAGAVQRTVEDARARHACGTTGGIGQLVPDCPLGTFCFSAACQTHDRCYSECETERVQCDRRFRSDLVAACLQQFPLKLGPTQQCLSLALIYWGTVVQFGGSFFPCFDNPPPIDDPLDGPGACCQLLEGTFCETLDRASDCPTEAVFIPGFDCTQVDATFGGCPTPINDMCDQATPVCVNQPRVSDPDLGTCTPVTGAAGDRPCSLSSQDCPGVAACLVDNRMAFRCPIVSDNRLAQTDGPPGDRACLASGADRFRADVWYEYVAPCSGALTAQMCQGTRYDSMIAIYGSDDPDGACVCPDNDGASLACDDDSCAGPGGPAVATYDGAIEGACYLFRVGGWSSDGTDAGTSRGLGQIQIGIVCDGGDGS